MKLINTNNPLALLVILAVGIGLYLFVIWLARRFAGPKVLKGMVDNVKKYKGQPDIRDEVDSHIEEMKEK